LYVSGGKRTEIRKSQDGSLVERERDAFPYSSKKVYVVIMDIVGLPMATTARRGGRPICT